jgi:hypothetical protein
MAKARLTARLTSRAGTKVGHSDPVVLYGRAIAQPGAVAGPKGMAVRHLKRYVSWVQNVVRQFGPYLLWALEI